MISQGSKSTTEEDVMKLVVARSASISEACHLGQCRYRRADLSHLWHPQLHHLSFSSLLSKLMRSFVSMPLVGTISRAMLATAGPWNFAMQVEGRLPKYVNCGKGTEV